MNTERLFELVKTNTFLESARQIAPESRLIEDLEYDSIKLLGLIVAIESEFSLSIINDTNMYKFFSIETVAELMEVIGELSEMQ